jgi:hypothetical protein
MTEKTRQYAVKVASDHPLRYRLIREAAPDERTSGDLVPEHLVLLLAPERWVSRVSLFVSSVSGRLMTDQPGIEVEPPEGWRPMSAPLKENSHAT